MLATVSSGCNVVLKWKWELAENDNWSPDKNAEACQICNGWEEVCQFVVAIAGCQPGKQFKTRHAQGDATADQ